jgi:hypothetical protein
VLAGVRPTGLVLLHGKVSGCRLSFCLASRQLIRIFPKFVEPSEGLGVCLRRWRAQIDSIRFPSRHAPDIRWSIGGLGVYPGGSTASLFVP